MQIIKQNLFLVIVGGVLLVGAGVLLVMTHQKDDQKTQMMQDREKAAGDIHAIPKDRFIKFPERLGDLPVQIKELQIRLEDLKGVDDKVKTECGIWNCRNYKVLQLRGENKPAFPDVDRIETTGYLVLAFKDTYRQELDKLLDSMSPVKPATKEELDDETNIHLTQLQQEAARKWAAEKKKHPTSNSASKPAEGSSESSHGGVSGGEETAPQTDFSAQAREEAVKTLMLRQATQGGKIYISPGVMNSFFGTSRDPSAKAEELWQAQFNLWVQGDIVQAINDANDEAAALVHAKQASVLASAVRRLLRINVEKEYSTGSASAAPASTGGGAVAPAAGGAAGGKSLVDTAGPAAAPSAGGTGEGDLTQHFCNKDYDVVHYDFTVVMPARYVPILESCLMKRNFHTILTVEIGPLSAAATAVIGGGAAKASIPPYYGPDAVVEVTFKGELLLLTSWERGKYNATDKKWELPPLMPKEVMDALKPVLRPQDADYLAGKITYPAATTTPASK